MRKTINKRKQLLIRITHKLLALLTKTLNRFILYHSFGCLHKSRDKYRTRESWAHSERPNLSVLSLLMNMVVELSRLSSCLYWEIQLFVDCLIDQIQYFLFKKSHSTANNSVPLVVSHSLTPPLIGCVL